MRGEERQGPLQGRFVSETRVRNQRLTLTRVPGVVRRLVVLVVQTPRAPRATLNENRRAGDRLKKRAQLRGTRGDQRGRVSRFGLDSSLRVWLALALRRAFVRAYTCRAWPTTS